MKTAISVPDPVFDAAENVARRLKISRSELYTRAVADFVDRHRTDKVTAALNRVYSQHSSALDPILARMQYLSLPEEEW